MKGKKEIWNLLELPAQTWSLLCWNPECLSPEVSLRPFFYLFFQWVSLSWSPTSVKERENKIWWAQNIVFFLLKENLWDYWFYIKYSNLEYDIISNSCFFVSGKKQALCWKFSLKKIIIGKRRTCPVGLIEQLNRKLWRPRTKAFISWNQSSSKFKAKYRRFITANDFILQ